MTTPEDKNTPEVEEPADAGAGQHAEPKPVSGILGLDPETRAAVAAALGQTHATEEITDSIEDLIPTSNASTSGAQPVEAVGEVEPADSAEPTSYAADPGTDGPEIAESGSGGGEVDGSGTAESGSGGREVADSEATDSEAAGSEAGEPGTAEPGTAEPGTAEPEAGESGVARSEVVEAEAGESGVAEPETGGPEEEEGIVRDPLPDLTEDHALQAALEALLLVIDGPAEEESLADALDQPVKRIRQVLTDLAQRYHDQERGIDLRNVGGGWRFHTRDRFAPFVEKLLLGGQRAKLTRAALESLAVIAYRQPVTRARVAAVRGVNVDGVIRTLVLRGLIEETGTDRETGGILYRTTELFLERLGLSSLTDLPPIAPSCPKWMRSTMSEPEGVRLQKVLSKAGVASRRAAEELIAEGRVSVDGKVVREFGTRVDPVNAVIHVDGVRVVLSEDLIYLAFNKPIGVHSTMTDDRGRPCVGDYVHKYERNANAGIFHVGRLDAETEGLLLLTNDGDLGHRLMHPSFEVPKTYLAEVPGPVPRDLGRRLREGSSWRTASPAPTRSSSSTRCPARPPWRSCCTRAASTSCGGCSPRWGTRSNGWYGPRWARSGWATSGRARCAR
ncbi:hypothetical protein GCM10029964_093760 [Kibdelosporangium lantanae]